MKKLLLMLMLIPSTVFAQSAPFDITKGLTKSNFDQAFESKVDTSNGTSTGQLLTTPSVVGNQASINISDSAASTNQGIFKLQSNNGTFSLSDISDDKSTSDQIFYCYRSGVTPVNCTFNVPITTPAGTFAERLNGPIRGTWPNLYFAPSPEFQKDLTITSMVPQLYLKSYYSGVGGTLWYDESQNMNYSTSAENSSHIFYTTNGSIKIIDGSSSASLFMYPSGTSTPISLWANSSFDLNLQSGASSSVLNSDINLFARGTGHINVNGVASFINNSTTGTVTSYPQIWSEEGLALDIQSGNGTEDINLLAGTGHINLKSVEQIMNTSPSVTVSTWPQLWTSENLDLNLQSGNGTSNINLYAGTGNIVMYSPIKLSTSNFTSDTSKCGSQTNSKGCLSYITPSGDTVYVNAQ